MNSIQESSTLEIQAVMGIMNSNCKLIASFGDPTLMNAFKLWWTRISAKLQLKDRDGNLMEESEKMSLLKLDAYKD